MKSEKVKEYINCIVPNKGNFDYCAEAGRLNGSIYVDVCKAVELAEQEAEERMRREAEEAFLSCCYCEEHQYVRKKCENCEAYKSFIQKLSEG